MARAIAFTEFTAEKKAKFLRSLAKYANISRACRAAHITRPTAYKHKDGDAEFAVAWGEALQGAVEDLEFEARRRAHDGVKKPIYQGGKQVGTVREYSDTLLIFLLKAHSPEKYRERSNVDITSAGKPILFIEAAASANAK